MLLKIIFKNYDHFSFIFIRSCLNQKYPHETKLVYFNTALKYHFSD